MLRKFLVYFSFFVLATSILLVIQGTDHLPMASAASPNSKPLHFYFHYVANPVFVAGSATYYTMDTTRNFANPSSFYKPIGQPKMSVDFYLQPQLAAPVTLDGEWQILIWVNGSALHPTGWNVRYFERNPNGAIVWDSSSISPTVIGGPTGYNGYLGVARSGYTLSTKLTHTFERGNSIQVEVTVNTGSTVAARIWYDSPSYPSQAILPSQDYARPSSIMTYDANNTAQNSFSVFWRDDQRKVIIRANVSDPFGGYDIYMVNMSISDQTNRVILPNQPMKKISGEPFSYLSVYEGSWSYPRTALVGNYSVKTSVVDLNGQFQYIERGVFEPYVEEASNIFSIGVQHRIQIQALDTHRRPLVNADISASLSGTVVARGTTNSSGWWDIVLSTGFYDVSVFWQGIKVAVESIKVVGPENFIIKSSVFDPVFFITDNSGTTLESAWVYVASPNGTFTALPFITDAHGRFSLIQTPEGSYGVKVLWKSVTVAELMINVSSDGPYPIKGKVYHFTSRIDDSNGRPVQDAFVVLSSPAGVIFDFSITNTTGQTLSRLPIGEYTISVYWKGVLVNRTIALVDHDVHYLIQSQIYSTTLETFDDEGRPVQDAFISISSSGTIFDSGVTDASGQISSRLPIGKYTLSVFWKDVSVHLSEISVDHDGLYRIKAQIYRLTVNVTDNAKQPLKGAYVTVSSGEKLFAFDITRDSGAVSFTLPKENYQVSIYYNTTYWLNSISNFTQINVPLTSRSIVQIPLSNYPPPLWVTIGFWLIVIHILIVLVISIVYTYRRRRVKMALAKVASERLEGRTPDQHNR